MDKVAETLAALARGEKPVCIHCGAQFSYTVDGHAHRWECMTVYWVKEGTLIRYEQCHGREVAALRERIADVVARLERACAEANSGGEVEYPLVSNALRVLQGWEPVDYDAEEDA